MDFVLGALVLRSERLPIVVRTAWRQQCEAVGHMASQIPMFGLLSPLFLFSLGPHGTVPPAFRVAFPLLVEL